MLLQSQCALHPERQLESPTIRRITVNRFILPFITTSALIFGVLLPREEAAAQTAKDLIGTWTLVSVTLERDGKKSDLFGPNPQGQVTFDPNGRMSLMITRSDLPKFASNNRQAGTPEENKAIVQGSITYFGTYSVSETDKTIATHIEGGTFPNWIGTDQKRSFTISGEELKWTTPTTSLGSGTAVDVWKRAK
jgi:Lipocalin-like domain